MKIKLIKFIPVLFFALVFVLPVALVATEAKSRHSEFAEGDRDPPSFICKQVPSPKIHGGIRKEVVSEYSQKTLVVFAAFSDQVISSDTSEEEKEAKESLFIGEKSVSRYYKKITQDKIIIEGDVLSGWKSLPKTHSEYSENRVPGDLDTFSILTDTITVIDDDVNLTDYQRIVIFLKGGYYSVAFGTQGKWEGIDSDDGLLSISVCWIGIEDIGNQFTLRHEIGHTFDWGHAGATVLKENETCSEVCSAKDIIVSDFDQELSECVGYEYGNELDIMGNGGGIYEENYSTSVFNLRKLGVVNDDQVFEAKESATVTLIPRSSSSKEGFKLVSTEGIDDDGTKKTYHAELYAKVEGNFDHGSEKSQIILYCTNEEGYLDYVSTLRFMSQNEENPYNPSPFDFKKTSFCDPVSGVQIELIDEYGEGEDARAEIKITLNCPSEERNPVVSASSDYDSIDITTGLEKSFEVELFIVNSEAMACGTRTFNITAKLPEKWTISSLPSFVDIGPFSSVEIVTLINVSEDTSDGFYNLIFQVVDSENKELKGEKSLTVEVFHKEMILSVTINEIKATDDIIVVSKGDWVRVEASVFGWYDEELMESLRADKITCQVKRQNGKVKYSEEKQNSYEGNFAFKPKKKGQFEVEVVAYKDGYQTASFQAKLKVE